MAIDSSGSPRDAARLILGELEAIAAKSDAAAGAITLVNCLLGNLDETVHWAERAIAQRDLQVLGIKTTPAYANLRSDPRISRAAGENESGVGATRRLNAQSPASFAEWKLLPPMIMDTSLAQLLHHRPSYCD